jgi:hypothetical protein
METYKPIAGWPRYEVSDLGNVRNVVRGNIRKPSIRPYGYRNVILTHADGRHGGFYVHRLVAQAFVPNPDNLPEVDHDDTNPANNAATNLKWCTHARNIALAIERNGGHWRTGKPNQSKWTAYVAKSETETLRFKSLRHACEHFGKKYSTFAPVINRAAKLGWSAYEYYWQKE